MPPTACWMKIWLLEGQVDRCRTILREMVAFGKAQLSQEPERLTVGQFIHGCLERFQLLRPRRTVNCVVLDDNTSQHRAAHAAGFAPCTAQPAQQRGDASASAIHRWCIDRGARWQLAAVDRARSRPWLHGDRRTPLLGESQKQAALVLAWHWPRRPPNDWRRTDRTAIPKTAPKCACACRWRSSPKVSTKRHDAIRHAMRQIRQECTAPP
jgi:hypothetical protein